MQQSRTFGWLAVGTLFASAVLYGLRPGTDEPEQVAALPPPAVPASATAIPPILSSAASSPEPELLFPAAAVLAAPVAKPACPKTANGLPDSIVREANWNAAKTEQNPVTKFSYVFNSLQDANSALYAELGVARHDYNRALQDSAHAAYTYMIKLYPHGRLQSMSQDETRHSPPEALRLLRDVHALRWSMSNLFISPNGEANVGQGYAFSGLDRDMVQKVIARLSILAFPEVVSQLKSMSEQKSLTLEQMEDHWMHSSIVEYVAKGYVYTDAQWDEADFPMPGFQLPRDFAKVKNKADRDLAVFRGKFAARMTEGCPPSIAASEPR